jgi:hypothetical protein
VIVWLWDAHGPDCSASGVSDDKKRARQAARESLRRTGAEVALVEQAYIALELGTLAFGYQRTGTGWTGRRNQRGAVRWQPLRQARERTAASVRR